MELCFMSNVSGEQWAAWAQAGLSAAAIFWAGRFSAVQHKREVAEAGRAAVAAELRQYKALLQLVEASASFCEEGASAAKLFQKLTGRGSEHSTFQAFLRLWFAQAEVLVQTVDRVNPLEFDRLQVADASVKARIKLRALAQEMLRMFDGEEPEGVLGIRLGHHLASTGISLRALTAPLLQAIQEIDPKAAVGS